MKSLPRTLLFYLALLLSLNATAQPETTQHVQVGIVDAPPYCIQDQTGNWGGMTVQLWRHLADKAHMTFDFQEFSDTDELIDAIAGGDIDIALSTDLSSELTDSVRFLQHHHLTTLGVARPNSSKLWETAKGVFSKQFLYIVLALSGLLLIIGTIIYFLERKGNEEQFGGDRSLAEGIGSGFWWAGVTMTTIGYGDKAPATLGGRTVAMLWMLLAMAVSASLTAAVVNAVNAGNDLNFPEDLREARVGVAQESAARDYLQSNDYQYQAFNDNTAAMVALSKGDLDVVVGDVAALRYIVNNNDRVSTNVTATNSLPVAHAITVRDQQELRDELDGEVIDFILSPTWRSTVKQYGGGN